MHRWQVLERYPRVEKSFCILCGCRRVKINLPDEWPKTQYTHHGYVSKTAPKCELEVAA